MKKKKMGFTLVELLAVIVILAVILVIAVPRITEVIENSRKATFESSAKTIAAAAEKRKMENDILENTDTISCSDVVNINETDYLSCSITFEDDTAKVSMIGSGKFDNMFINDGTKDNAVAESSITLVNYVKNLYNDPNTRVKNNLKIDNTVDKNVRYYGANPNNYVKFKDSDEVWRIIGLFDGYVKLVSSSSVGNKLWKAGESGVNGGWGVNQWGESIDESDNSEYDGADVMVYLNGDYYNSLSDVAKSAIDYHLWNTAGVEDNLKNTVDFYNAERGTKTGKMCKIGSHDHCTDTIKRTTEWQGYVALPYATDWAYASATSGCETNMQQQDSDSVYTCKNDNWMHSGKYISWFLSPTVVSWAADGVWMVTSSGVIGGENAAGNSWWTFSSIFLKSNVVIIDGSGTSSDSYVLSVN